ncbi:1-acylglycerol-3-phosphate O-acyltransferase [Gordonia araii NBRC 100433]|uniref:1-acylglycerol-3-phosphate O-acyltransferase n=1 Tax=Gordonia araii NBRC 100433 TaxID=1073574 RepID=G7H4A6_9ACTN|nr:lysophospholipid acyltransferase family protein [Gordonia araii]NNG96261.1 1-acyl-sn-glycerol-3-phosphate acyltransferase [Gordonia araii NBRC 100433]GAB10681.1 1-acylglycerol-3-phosphate O-acyltransferase [Gordonia araii NBRC 100433]
MTKHAWYPVGECDDACVRGPRRRAARTRQLLRIGRVLAVLVVLALAAPVVWRIAPQRRHRFSRWAARRVLAALGVAVVVNDRRLIDTDPRVPIGGLIVANHVSFLDILAIATLTPARFVAKSDVLDMPGFGRLARRIGVIGVERGSLRRLPGTVERVADALRDGAAVAVFPEGTTWCGAAWGRFRPAFIGAAHAAGAPIMPMTVSFTEDDGYHCSAPAFIGDDSPVDTLRRILAVRSLTVTVTAHRVQLPTPDRRADARAAQAVVFGETAGAARTPAALVG